LLPKVDISGEVYFHASGEIETTLDRCADDCQSFDFNHI
jgi:hypothetical protein